MDTIKQEILYIYDVQDKQLEKNIKNLNNKFESIKIDYILAHERIYENSIIILEDTPSDKVEALRKINSAIRIIYISSSKDIDEKLLLAQLSAYLYMPVDTTKLKETFLKSQELLNNKKTQKIAHENNIEKKVDTIEKMLKKNNQGTASLNTKSKTIYFPSGAYFEQNTQIIFYKDTPYILSNIENRLFKILLHNANNIVPRDQIDSMVWHKKNTSKSTLKSALFKLRKKIGKESILSYSKRGYKLLCQSTPF